MFTIALIVCIIFYWILGFIIILWPVSASKGKLLCKLVVPPVFLKAAGTRLVWVDIYWKKNYCWTKGNFMKKLKNYLTFSLFVQILILSLTGCNGLSSELNLQEAIKEKFLEKLTIQEYELFINTIFAEDESIDGSIAWIGNKVKEISGNEDSLIMSSAIFVLFEYPSYEFPSDYEEGMIESNVDYSISGSEFRVSEYPEWFNIARLHRESCKTIAVWVRLSKWFSMQKEKPDNRRVHIIEEKFELENGKWKLVKIKDTICKEQAITVTEDTKD